MNLEGYWKFRRGDNMNWKAPDYDDNGWKQIHVPGIWEDQVSRDYNGFGWYRKSFRIPEAWEGERYVLMLGKIDDADEVYINGEMVGHTGELHKNPSRIQLYDEHNQSRYYYLKREDLNPGTINTIAIRVFDRGGEGGIYKGPVGLVELRKFVRFWRNR
jgi:sialate O-acetylesterase